MPDRAARGLFATQTLPSVVKLIEVSLFAAVLAARSNGSDVDVARKSVLRASSPSSFSSSEVNGVCQGCRVLRRCGQRMILRKSCACCPTSSAEGDGSDCEMEISIVSLSIGSEFHTPPDSIEQELSTTMHELQRLPTEES